MFKRILLSLAIIGTVGSSAVVGTRALLSDTVSLTANTYSVGSVNLEISKDGDPDWHDTTVTGFSATNLLPGASVTNYAWLRNTSTTDLALTGQAFGVSVTGLAKTDVTLSITPVDGSGTPTGGLVVTKTLDQWESSPQVMANILANTQQRYEFKVTLSSGITTSGSNATFSMNFVGTQNTP